MAKFSQNLATMVFTVIYIVTLLLVVADDFIPDNISEIGFGKPRFTGVQTKSYQIMVGLKYEGNKHRYIISLLSSPSVAYM